METRTNRPSEESCRTRVVHLERVIKAREGRLPNGELDQLALMFKILGDPTRLKIMMALADGEMCVCDIAAFLTLSESAISHQLRRLKDLLLVKRRRDNQTVYYSLNDEHVHRLITIGLEHVRG
jgi:DNA-binding transcriptional ArsR family regulator